MSLYNALFGENPMADVLLSALGLTRSDVPRYRDCYLDQPGGQLRIVIHTRTGGGNRKYYESEEDCRRNYPGEFENDPERPPGPWNSDLQALPTYLSDQDSRVDDTYANFYFAVPDSFVPLVTTLLAIGAGTIDKPEERWKKLFAGMSAGEQTADAKRALEVGKAIFAKLGIPSGKVAE